MKQNLLILAAILLTMPSAAWACDIVIDDAVKKEELKAVALAAFTSTQVSSAIVRDYNWEIVEDTPSCPAKTYYQATIDLTLTKGATECRLSVHVGKNDESDVEFPDTYVVSGAENTPCH